VDGVIVKSITECLKYKFGGKYCGVDKGTLQRAADRGTDIHRAIELWCKDGTPSEHVEVRNFKFLQTQYCFEVIANEVPVIMFEGDKPIFDGENPLLAGRLDLVLKMDGKLGLADIKTTATLDKEYLGYQLNLYRIAFEQCYGRKIEFLRGIHLKEDKRKFVDIPINEQLVMDYLKDWRIENE
jgi:hypothetical protein